MLVDPSEAGQDYIEDCEVCCRPISLHVEVDDDERVRLVARRGDD
ncbi:MAG: CPXCG motif-containing cysteine-rich protein [Proteobacteria bacterium]|nr:CPXCG motif-containing cysteine-rich protein [Pseudomonadota bacterium]MBK8960628.1 CPXCG motif-containing cysteine-rich protein [Pseudomonadota bacterium]